MRSGCEHKRKSTEMSLTLSAQVNEYGIDAKVDSSKKSLIQTNEVCRPLYERIPSRALLLVRRMHTRHADTMQVGVQ